MKKKGFTLIELLATIVILAIIALIAIPLIGNVIEKAKIGALESSVNGLVESANMYYANNTIKGETITETTFDFEDGEQISTQKLEYKGKVYNGKLILHANGEVAVCIDDEEHYAYKNKDTDEIVSGNGTCLYDGTTGDFSSNNSINDLRGKTLVATQIEESGDNAIITIPEEGHVDSTSKISVPIETMVNQININSNVAYFETISSSTWTSNGYTKTIPYDGNNSIGSNFEISSDYTEITVKESGTYAVYAADGIWGYTVLGIYVNDALVAGSASATMNSPVQSVATKLSLNANDKITVKVVGTAWQSATCGYTEGSFLLISKKN